MMKKPLKTKKNQNENEKVEELGGDARHSFGRAKRTKKYTERK